MDGLCCGAKRRRGQEGESWGEGQRVVALPTRPPGLRIWWWREKKRDLHRHPPPTPSPPPPPAGEGSLQPNPRASSSPFARQRPALAALTCVVLEEVGAPHAEPGQGVKALRGEAGGDGVCFSRGGHGRALPHGAAQSGRPSVKSPSPGAGGRGRCSLSSRLGSLGAPLAALPPGRIFAGEEEGAHRSPTPGRPCNAPSKKPSPPKHVAKIPTASGAPPRPSPMLPQPLQPPARTSLACWRETPHQGGLCLSEICPGLWHQGICWSPLGEACVL